jgi:hypothetical protein
MTDDDFRWHETGRLLVSHGVDDLGKFPLFGTTEDDIKLDNS